MLILFLYTVPRFWPILFSFSLQESLGAFLIGKSTSHEFQFLFVFLFLPFPVVKGNFCQVQNSEFVRFFPQHFKYFLHSWRSWSNSYLLLFYRQHDFPRSGFFYDFCSLFPLFLQFENEMLRCNFGEHLSCLVFCEVPRPAIWCLALTGGNCSRCFSCLSSSPAGIPYYAWATHL